MAAACAKALLGWEELQKLLTACHRPLGLALARASHTQARAHTHTHRRIGTPWELHSPMFRPCFPGSQLALQGLTDMRRTSQTHLLVFFLCLFPQVSTQLCPTPCACPWPPPRCPPGVPLVPDGCGCCRVCARRLGEPCDHLHVCDSSQGLVCQPGTGPGGRGATCLFGEDAGSCEVNGHLYRDGDTFQPHCRALCRCEDGGFTCVPLCNQDVRLPSWDCPHPTQVEVPGKCCPEWVCDQGGGLRTQPLPARGPQFSGLVAPPAPSVPCPEWSTAWGPCSTTCGLGVATRVSNQNRFCRLETQRRLCLPGPCPPAGGRSPRSTAF